MKVKIYLRTWLLLVSLLSAAFAQADTSTWNPNPANGTWRRAANWTPAKVPNGADTAVFGTSSITSVTLNLKILLNELNLAAGAGDYTITLDPTAYLYFETVGITNNSGLVQNFICPASTDGTSSSSLIQFRNNTSVGSQIVFTAGGSPGAGVSGAIDFDDQSSAGDALFICEGSFGRAFTYGGKVSFAGTSTAANATFMLKGGGGSGGGGGTLNFGGNFATPTAANATITAEGASVAGAYGSSVGFLTQATAGSANIVANGGAVASPSGGASIIFTGAFGGDSTLTVNGALADGAAGAVLLFQDSSNASNATCIINGATGSRPGGQLLLKSNSLGGTSRVEVFGNGSVDLSGHIAPGITIGSLEGDGLVSLGSNTLTIGSNNLTTKFAGTTQGAGSLNKIGSGALTLSGANTYSGVTTVTAGSLIISNTIGSGTGTGSVTAQAGTLGGKGIIAGATTIATGAVLQPGAGASTPATLTIQNSLTFKSSSTYLYKLNTSKVRADQVSANGVTIESGAQFSFNPVANKKLATGTVFTAISNTAATPISGTFANLADGSILAGGRNNFQVSYHGGDGNDLTLTVVP